MMMGVGDEEGEVGSSIGVGEVSWEKQDRALSVDEWWGRE